MPKPQNKTKCGVCHEYKGIYVKMLIEGLIYWACVDCLKSEVLS